MAKIKLKDGVLIYDGAESFKIRFGNEAFSVEDEDKSIRNILSLFDGKYSIDGVIQLLSGKVPKEFILDVYKNFNEALLLEDSQHETCLLPYEQERWSRNFNFFASFIKCDQNKYHYQEKIKEAKVLLLGCGGLGSHILYELAAVGFTQLTIVDFDKIELSNLNRQILYKEIDIGSEKVFTAKKRIEEFSKDIRVEAISQKISSSEDVSNLINGHDLVICVADKPRTQIVPWLNEACVRKNTPFINGGLNHTVALIYSVIPHITGCTECWKSYVDQTNKDASSILDQDFGENIEFIHPAPAFSPLVSTLTGLFLCEAIKIITDISPPSFTNKKIVFNFANSTIKEEEAWEKKDDCKLCGS